MNRDECIHESKLSKLDGVLHLKIRAGSDLLAGIKEGLRKHNIKSGVFLSGIGALERAVFRNLRVFPDKYPVTPQDRLYFVVDKPLELLSISGWVGEKTDGDIEVHAHISASYVEKDKVVAVGGHLTDGVIASIKLVIAIGVLSDGSILAALDEETQSLDIKMGE